MTLPAALSRWAPTLSVLQPRLAVAVGPMVRNLDELIRRGDRAAASVGSFDGYGGIARRGDPARLLMSEWALAESAPMEFLRRAAGAELLHLEPQLVDDVPRGRVAVLVDSGPDQFGAGRLVQLAALIVLIARAQARNADLLLGVLGQRPGTWTGADARRLLDNWLHSRTAATADAADVIAWDDTVENHDEVWLLTGPALARQLPARRRLLITREAAWDGHGATAVDVTVDGHRAELALPHGDAAVRALRGALFQRDARPSAMSPVRGPFTFTSGSSDLLARGSGGSELVRVDVRAGQAGRPRRHRFNGDVLTAATLGRRVVALLHRRDDIVVEVVGKHLGRVDDIVLPADEVGVTDVMAPGPLTPLVYVDGCLLARLGGAWWRLSPDEPPQCDDTVLAVRPGEQTDTPLIARRQGDRVIVGHRTFEQERSDDWYLGGGDLIGRLEDGTHLHLVGGATVEIPTGERIIGLHRVDDAPAVVTLSRNGLIVRLRSPVGQRTLTAWSGGSQPPSVHPTRPWLAVHRDNGRVEVADLATGNVIASVGTP